MSDLTTGERVAAYRRQRGMSQKALAAEMRRSESWVSQVERGVQPIERLSVLRDLAMVLGVTVRDLRPEALPAAEQRETSTVNDLDSLRLGLSGHPALAELVTPSGSAEPASVSDLNREVDHAWELVHADRFADLSATLTGLVPHLELAVRQVTNHRTRRRLHGLLARAYQAAAAAFVRQDEADAAWVAADRAITSAELAGDPLEVVAGHFRLAFVFLRLRRFDQAEHVTTAALEALRPRVKGDAPPEVLSLTGAMHLVHALVSAHAGDRTAARTHLDLAGEIGERLGEDRNDFDTEFGPTNVQLHRVAVAVDLGDAGEALDVAEQVDASHLSPERQARFLVDIASAHAQRRQLGDAIAALTQADQLAPEHVRTHVQPRSTIEELLALAGRRPPAELVDLARRAGLTPLG